MDTTSSRRASVELRSRRQAKVMDAVLALVRSHPTHRINVNHADRAIFAAAYEGEAKLLAADLEAQWPGLDVECYDAGNGWAWNVDVFVS